MSEDAEKVFTKVEKGLRNIMLFVIAITVIYSFLFFQDLRLYKEQTIAANTPAIEQPHIWKGEYTIFQYTQHGWANRLYVTEFYIQEGVIYYKSREHQSEYLPVEFDNTLTVPGWVEDNNELMNYGYWQPAVD